LLQMPYVVEKTIPHMRYYMYVATVKQLNHYKKLIKFIYDK